MTESGCVTFGQRVNQFIVKVIILRGHRGWHALLVHLAAAINVFFQALIQIVAAASVGDFGFVVKLDLRNEQPGETARVIVRSDFRLTGIAGKNAG